MRNVLVEQWWGLLAINFTDSSSARYFQQLALFF
jgi:hypothetical protein